MSTSIKPAYAIVGHDALKKREMLAALIDAVGKTGDTPIPTRFDGREADAADVLDAVRTYSLWGGRPIVILDNADPFISANREPMEKYLTAPCEAGVLVLMCNALAANTRVYKFVDKIGRVIKCDPPRGGRLDAWIVHRARANYGKRVDQRTARRLRDLVGDTVETLDSELSKLSMYVADRPAITVDDLDALLEGHREQNVFAITDAMAAGNVAAAIHHWQRVLATDRAAPGRAIGGLAWGVRRLLELKLLNESGQPVAALSKRAYTSPEQLRRRLAAWSVAALQRQLGDLMRADLAVKLSASKLDVAVERFIMTHTRRRA